MLTPLYRLEHFDLIACTGADAEAFLQAQLSNDVRMLSVKGAQWTAQLNAQGRVVATLALVRLDIERFVLIVPHHRGTEVLAGLRKFLLRRKCRLELDEVHAVFGSERMIDASGLVPLTLPGFEERQLYIGDREQPALAMPGDWIGRDLKAGIPWLRSAAAERHLPHALGLDKLPAISLKKGCYPGQEIVARTHYLGRNKRGLCLVQSTNSDAAIATGAQLRDAENQLAGELVDVAADASGTIALAVLSEERVDLRLFAEGSHGQRQEFGVVRRFGPLAEPELAKS